MSELKFDRARFEAGEHPTRTRDGKKVLHIYDSGIGDFPIAAWIEGGGTATYTRDGKWGMTLDRHPLDLVHEPKKRTVHIVLCRSALDGAINAITNESFDNFEAVIKRTRDEGRFVAELTHEVEE